MNDSLGRPGAASGALADSGALSGPRAGERRNHLQEALQAKALLIDAMLAVAPPQMRAGAPAGADLARAARTQPIAARAPCATPWHAACTGCGPVVGIQRQPWGAAGRLRQLRSTCRACLQAQRLMIGRVVVTHLPRFWTGGASLSSAIGAYLG